MISFRHHFDRQTRTDSKPLIQKTQKNHHKQTFHKIVLSTFFFCLFSLIVFIGWLFSAAFHNSNDDSVPHLNDCDIVVGTGAENGRGLIDSDKVAVCLIGGARRFELTGPTIVDNVLKVYPQADLFLHSPLDTDSFKFSLLKIAPKITSVRIFNPDSITVTESHKRLLSPAGSPKGIQGLLQYFNLVEGCLGMVQAHQAQNNFTYDWIIRTRVDSYWNGPLDPINFVKGRYMIPQGSSYGGINDRLGIGDYNSSVFVLSRLSILPELDAAGYTLANSETLYKAQFTVQGVPFCTNRVPFCIVSDRKYRFPLRDVGVPVAAISSPGPLSGAKCRVCQPVCEGDCARKEMSVVNKDWGWTEWKNGSLQICDARREWTEGWENEFDRVAGSKLASERTRVRNLSLEQCIEDFDSMMSRANHWDAPPPEEICKMGIQGK